MNKAQDEWERDTPEGRASRDRAEGMVAMDFAAYQRRKAARCFNHCPRCAAKRRETLHVTT